MYFFFDLLFCVLILVIAVCVVAAAVVGVVLSGLFSNASDAIAVHVGSSIANTPFLHGSIKVIQLPLLCHSVS